MRKVVLPAVVLALLASAGEAKAQTRIDRVVIGIFPNGAVFVVRVHQSAQGTFAGAGARGRLPWTTSCCSAAGRREMEATTTSPEATRTSCSATAPPGPIARSR